MKKQKNLEKEKLLNQKENLRNFNDYLVDSFYLNPDKKYNKDEILFELKINDCPTINAYIDYLKDKKYIKFKKEEFIITFDGFEYLEKKQRINMEYENNLFSATTSMVAILISIFGVIFDNTIINSILIVILFIFMDYQTKDIFNKKYY